MITFQVPLGIILKNENKIDEMTEILTDLHQYVPCVTQEESASLSTGQVVTKKTEYMHRILIGGDQLTVARMRSAINIKNNSWTATGRLEGFIPVAEDWHTKAIYLDVSWLMPQADMVLLWDQIYFHYAANLEVLLCHIIL